MALVQQRNDIQTSPLVKSMSSLNQQMNNSLTDANQPDEIRIKNHEQLFQRYLGLQEQRENHIPTVKLHSSEATVPQGSQPPQESQLPQEPQDQPQTKPITDSEILETVPKKFKGQAEGLLRWIRKTPEAVQWDDKGVVSLEGQPLDGTSISDLINDSLRKRKGFQPQGRDAFTKVLATLNTPDDFIRNEDRRQLMGLFKTGGRLPPNTPEDRMGTFLPTPPSTPRKEPISPLTRKRGLRPSSRGRKRAIDWLPY